MLAVPLHDRVRTAGTEDQIQKNAMSDLPAAAGPPSYPLFVTRANRDAYATIRGYVYQAERTIQAWIDLPEGTILLCEAGEDIDWVGSPTGASVTPERILEQVKHLGRNLSLRSAAVAEALGNFLRAAEDNPGWRIAFRLFTNAAPAKETGARFPRDLTGIEAWQMAAAGNLTAEEVSAFVRELRRVLSVVAPDVPAEAARRLTEFLVDADDERVVAALVRPVEWSTRAPDARALQPEIEARLGALGVASREVYPRLLLHVLRELSSSGLKRFDRERLQSVLGERVESGADRALLSAIRVLLDRADQALVELAGSVQAVREQQTAMNQRLTTMEGVLEGSTTATGGNNFSIQEAPDEPPPAPAVFAPRETLIDDLRRRTEDGGWIGLVASSNMGKSQLARVLHDGYQARARWIGLRDPGESPAVHLDRQILLWYRALTGDERLAIGLNQGLIGPRALVRSVADAAGEGALLVLDDVPDVNPGDELDRRLRAIAENFRGAGRVVLSTSQRSLPEGARAVLGETFTEVVVPPLTIADVMDTLIAAGAPQPARTEVLAQFLQALTHGHPMLVTAVLRWLAERDWVIDDAQLQALFAGLPLRSERETARRTLTRIVDDADTRHLVDRLSLLDVPFDMAMLDAVATTDPTVMRARERLDAVLGPFVLRSSSGKFELSPLLRSAGDEYLPMDEQRRVHIAIGRAYLTRRILSPLEGFHACVHFQRGEDWRHLAFTLVSAGNAIRSADEARAIDWLTAFFPPGSPWPADITAPIRIFIRGLQVHALLLRDLPASSYEDDLDRLISDAGTEPGVAEAIMAVRIQNSVLIDTLPAPDAARRALQLARAIRQTDSSLVPHLGVPPETLFWAAVHRIRRLDQLEDVVATLETMTPDELTAAVASPSGRELAMLLADLTYSVTASVPEDARDWPMASRVLDRLEALGARPATAPLLASARRARAILMADYQDRVEEALQLLRDSQSGADEWSRFLLAFTQAAVLLAHGRPVEAADLFGEVLASPVAGEFDVILPDGLARGMQAAARASRWTEAESWAAQAIQRFRVRERGDSYTPPELLGELAWIHWEAGREGHACGAIYGAVAWLLARRDDSSSRYRETFLKVGHVLRWLAGAAVGQPPTKVADGGEYIRPFPGFLYNSRPAIGDYGVQREPQLLLYQVGQFAAAVHQRGIAARAFTQASECARSLGDAFFADFVDILRAFAESELGHPGDAVAAYSTGRRALAIQSNLVIGRSAASVDADAAWRSLDEGTRREKERLLFSACLLPTFFRLCSPAVGRDAIVRELDDLRASVVDPGRDFIERDRWLRLIEQTRAVATGSVHRRRAEEMVLEASAAEEQMVGLLALVLAPDAPLADIAKAQAAIAASLDRFDDRLVQTKLNTWLWIVTTWRDVAKRRGALLTSPGILRSALASLPEHFPTSSDAASVLLAAETCAAALYPGWVRARLGELARREVSTPDLGGPTATT